jgi:myosin heavy subunit
MKNLIDELESSEIHFVRCIKPNKEKKKGFF